MLYDFVGEPGSSELSVTAGETLVVTRKDVGEGWWEGTNVNGRTGLFPAAYVEVSIINLNLYNLIISLLIIHYYWLIQEIKTVTSNKTDESKPPPALPPPPLPPTTDPWDVGDQQNDYYTQVPSNQYQQQNAYSHQQASICFYSDEMVRCIFKFS